VKQQVFEEVKILKLCTTPMLALLWVSHPFDIQNQLIHASQIPLGGE
jgi:hypothetical protein